jgi:TetR/AcrR family transcriptional regulator
MRAEDRRDVIIGAARTEFARTGYEGTRVRAIADRAGINDAMLYRHFDSKEHLFDAAVAEPLEAAVMHIIERPMPPLPPDAGTDEMRDRSVAFYVEMLTAMRDVGPLLGIVLFGDRERGRQYYRDRLEPLFDRVVDLTADMNERWRHSEFDAELLHRTIFGSCWVIAIDAHYGSRGERPLEQTARQLVDLLFDGIGP